jgi:DNA-binding MarR family transcriptional regulator
MTKLSDTQAIILSAAAQRDDRNVLPLPGSLRGGAAAKVVGALLSRGLIAETVTDSHTKADAALNRFWRNDEDGRAVLLHITDAGLDAIGIETETAASDAPDTVQGAPNTAEGATQDTPPPAADTAPTDAPKLRKTREGTKQAQLIAMLRAEGGATIDEIVAALDWRPHTVRGALAGALKKKLGLTIDSEKVESRGRVYRIAD